MARPKGSVMPLTAFTEQVDEAVELCCACGQTEVAVKDVAELTRIAMERVANIMRRKSREGCFVPVGLGVYRRILGVRISKKLPPSFIAEKAWAVLDRNRARFVDSAYLIQEVETMAGRRELSLGRQVCKALSRWARHGYIERIGSAGDYAYRIFPGILSRPPTED